MLIIMVTLQSPGTGIAFRTAQPKRFRQVGRTPVVLKQFEEQDRVPKTDIRPEHYRELMLLDDFLTRHVRHDGFCDVQCMLLWTEWVRVFLRHTHRFPDVILEEEFRQVITNHLGVGIARDTIRGPVYPGIRFVR
jgi:hypothetical protein